MSKDIVDISPSELEDVVIEVRVRLSDLTYAQAALVRDRLRAAEREMEVVIEGVLMAVRAAAPEAVATRAWNPWAEWRPALGSKRNRALSNRDKYRREA